MHLPPRWLRIWWVRSWWKEERQTRPWPRRGMGLQLAAAGLLLAGLLAGARTLPAAILLLAGLLVLRITQQLARRRQRRQQTLEHKRNRSELQRCNRQLDALLRRLGGPQLVEELGSSTSLEWKLNRLASRLERLLQSARAQAQVDQLTQLPNRRQFLEQIQVASARSKRANQPFAVLFVDIDQFRNLNDTYGHTTGDRALIAVARKLQDTVRLGDFLARYGSDEFAILMDLSTIHDPHEETLKIRAYQFASRLVQSFSNSLNLGDSELMVNVSVGVSVVPPGETRAEEILRNLDTAIVQAKRQRHERVAIFDVNSDSSANLNDYQLFSDLRQAMREGQLHMAFQPVVNAEGGWLSLEALARWQHPTLGFIPPDRFIALAERYRLMGELGDLIFQLSLEGYAQILEATHQPHLRLSANISPTQLSDPELHQRLQTMLLTAGLTPTQITLEITEASVLEQNAATRINLEQLRLAGFRLSLDDFGTGYSSLNLLHTLQPNEVKIDQSFVRELKKQDFASQIVAVIAGMSSHMSLEIVAEGVEDIEILTALEALGIKKFQGYYFYRPMPPQQLIQHEEAISSPHN